MATERQGKAAAELVADRIRAVREELHLNQAEFAEALGVSRSHISETENYKVRVPVSLLFDIESKFGKKTKRAGVVALLVGQSQPVPWGDSPATSPLNSVLGLDRRALVSAFKSLDALERSEGIQYPSEMKARLLIRTLYVYISEMERARQQGTEIDEARRIAERACQALEGGFDLPHGVDV